MPPFTATLGLALLVGGCALAVGAGDLRLAPALCAVALAIVLAGAALALRAAHAISPWILLGGLVLARAVALTGAPSLSDDMHRYVHEGRAQRLGLATPYRVPPAALTPPGDDGTSARVNHKDIPAAYPPGAELFLLSTIALGDAVGAPRTPLRLALAAADLAILLLLFRRRRASPTAFLRYGAHPLPLLEVALSGHLDALGALCALVAVLCGGRPALAGAAAGLAMHVKPIGVLALIGLERGRIRALVVCAAVAVVLALPHIAAGAPLAGGLATYAARWRAAPIGYAVLEAPLAPPFERRAARGVYAHLHGSLTPPGVRLEESGRTVFALGTVPDGAARVLVDHRLLARGAALAALLALVVAAARLCTTPAARAGAAYLATCLFLPALHPWYALWLVPFAALTRGRALWVFSALTPLLYQPVFGAAHGEPWQEALWPRALLLGATLAAAVLDLKDARARSPA